MSQNKTSSAASDTPLPVDPKIEGKSYYHGKIPRDYAEMLLDKDEQFLVRYTIRGKEKGYVVTVRSRGKCRHFKINQNNKSGKFYISKSGPRCDLIHELIEIYVSQRKTLIPFDKEKDGVYLKEECNRSRWDFDRASVKLDKKLGAGEFGEVFKGKYKDQPVAVKTCKKTDPIDLEKFEKEAMFCLKFNHENIVKTIGIVRSKGVGGPDDCTMIIMEFCPKGELAKCLRKRQDQLKKETLLGFASDVVCGMAYLESKNIIHRDLAARNCLLSKDMVVKISDFGMAKEENYKMAKGKAPLRWMAPESIKFGTFTAQSDVWSFGVLLWEIWNFGKEPYGQMKTFEVKNAVIVDKYRMEPPAGMPSHIVSCMKACWEEKPSQRPSFRKLKRKIAKHVEGNKLSEKTARSVEKLSEKTDQTMQNTMHSSHV